MDKSNMFLLLLFGCFFFSIMNYIFCIFAVKKYVKRGESRIFGFVTLALAFLFSLFPLIYFKGDILFKIILMAFNVITFIQLKKAPLNLSEKTDENEGDIFFE